MELFQKDSDPNSINIKKAKDLIFHYSLFIDKIMDKPEATGFGFNPRNPDNEDPRSMNFIISLGILNDVGRLITSIIQEGTFMHELGHNLGLKHGGTNDRMFKPNYFSVMNYLFQTGDIERDLDYSGCFTTLNENGLNELEGIIDPCKETRMSAYFKNNYCATLSSQEELDTSRASLVQSNAPINWNNNHNINDNNVVSDINCDKNRSFLDRY